MKDLSLTLLGLTVVVTIFAKPVAASEVQFTSCLTPTGSVVADYANGTHGIAGQGVLGQQVLTDFMNIPLFKEVPVILELPSSCEAKESLEVLNRVISWD